MRCMTAETALGQQLLRCKSGQRSMMQMRPMRRMIMTVHDHVLQARRRS